MRSPHTRPPAVVITVPAFLALLAVAASGLAAGARAETITMNVDPVGTTSNLNIYGTTVTSGSATWPSRTQFRDYQFELLTASGSTTFDGFAVQLSSQLRNNTVAYGNLLRATLWAGPIVANPILTDSLVTVSTSNASFTNGSSGYSSLLLAGPSFTPQTISSAGSTFFFRVWAEGGSNDGYQSKMASTLGEFQAVTMTPAPAIDGYIEFDTNGDGVVDPTEESSTRDLIAEVPEPSTLALLACAAGMAAIRGRRRRPHVA